ncbi:hypothetical protein BBBOND_0110240 [Babesia bigemina]|uniref:Uncharacterized protein n=1 Tax=Babesia bigemina TaxID=5866 RepID=A0A061D1Q9_BABBI|nr:hypothetical protein BBBOND_0110240 [Babesia bigemina]CDR94726.1 hypothetical protein BBBOND_0110240 [Babesia bigemina]|eukprot:XP_012766912.1 hypothetical protein BBBOND_0110240 [Babesia bigemina]
MLKDIKRENAQPLYAVQGVTLSVEAHETQRGLCLINRPSRSHNSTATTDNSSNMRQQHDVGFA